MAEKLDSKELVLIEEPAISSMWEIAALVDLRERKGLLPKGKDGSGPHTGSNLSRGVQHPTDRPHQCVHAEGLQEQGHVLCQHLE